MSKDKKKSFKTQKTDKIKSLNYAVDNCERVGLSASDLAVWLILFRYERDGFTSVSQKRIAETLGCCVNHVNKVIKGLIERNVVSVVTKGKSNHCATKYRMVVVPRRTPSKKKKD